VCPVVKLVPLKFLNAGGSGSTTTAIAAVAYAASFVAGSGAKVIRITNNSWGGGSKSRALEDAIKNSGALFVASAGNPATSTKRYPAGDAQPNVLSVGATDHADALASFSNFGTWVHLAAPGVNVLSSMPGNTYGTLSGTSMATPHVVGAAALAMAQSPGLSVAGTKAQLLATVDVLPSLVGKVTSSGRLNARRAVGASDFPADAAAPNPIADLTAGSPASDALLLT
jgi:subtilisin family serine protease